MGELREEARAVCAGDVSVRGTLQLSLWRTVCLFCMLFRAAEGAFRSLTQVSDLLHGNGSKLVINRRVAIPLLL